MPRGTEPTQVVLVRHGQTVWNTEHRIQGHGDSPLTDQGRSQVAALADLLASWQVAALRSSDLPRACTTAGIIAARLGLEVALDARLRERHLGVLEGRTMGEVEAHDPELFHRWRASSPDWPVPGGESLRQRHERVVAAIQDAAAAYRGARVVLVTHGGGLDSAFRQAAGLSLQSPRRCAIPNAGLNMLEVAVDRWTIRTWACVGHLLSGSTREVGIPMSPDPNHNSVHPGF